MAKLDRVLVSVVDWENKNPLAKVTVLPKGVSDHSTMLIDFGGGNQQKDHLFRFEKWWLEVEGFTEMVSKAWETTCPHSDPLEIWQFKIRLLRKKIRGWHRNVEADIKRERVDIIERMDWLDKIAKLGQLTDHERGERILEESWTVFGDWRRLKQGRGRERERN
jgi:hypothetical protein